MDEVHLACEGESLVPDCILVLINSLRMYKVAAYITKPCLFLGYRYNIYFSTLHISLS